MKTQLPGLAFYYTKYQNDNQNNEKAYKKWYARPVNLGTVDVESVAQMISDKGCVYGEDVIKGVLEDFWYHVFDALFQNNWVKLPGLGTLRVGLNSEGASSESEFTADNIKGFKITLLPDGTRTQQLRRKDLRKRVTLREWAE